MTDPTWPMRRALMVLHYRMRRTYPKLPLLLGFASLQKETP